MQMLHVDRLDSGHPKKSENFPSFSIHCDLKSFRKRDETEEDNQRQFKII